MWTTWKERNSTNCNDVLRNPTCIKWSPNLNSVPMECACFTTSKSVIGGVLRDHTWKFLCLFSSPISFMEINPCHPKSPQDHTTLEYDAKQITCSAIEFGQCGQMVQWNCL